MSSPLIWRTDRPLAETFDFFLCLNRWKTSELLAFYRWISMYLSTGLIVPYSFPQGFLRFFHRFFPVFSTISILCLSLSINYISVYPPYPQALLLLLLYLYISFLYFLKYLRRIYFFFYKSNLFFCLDI